MKKIKMKVKVMLAVLLGFMAIFNGCKETELPKSINHQETEGNKMELAKINKAELEKLTRYISISTGLPIDQIVFDEKTEEFTVPGTPFKEKLVVMQKYYDVANEYKAKYEKKD